MAFINRDESMLKTFVEKYSNLIKNGKKMAGKSWSLSESGNKTIIVVHFGF